jgi:UDP-N-acetylglucosamine--N-acetylmuramyl-(pentapeptide) pyrophosphoryl-undecaprenol N-acetylglucosamine transferase
VLWQTGKGFIAQAQKLQAEKISPLLQVTDFIQRMDLAYSAADVVVSRAGALSIAELCLVQKPIILVPSPNVAEDHQNKNAQALVQEKAALLVADRYAEYFLVSDVLRLLQAPALQKEMSARIQKFAKPFATQDIAQHVIDLAASKA